MSMTIYSTWNIETARLSTRPSLWLLIFLFRTAIWYNLINFAVYLALKYWQKNLKWWTLAARAKHDRLSSTCWSSCTACSKKLHLSLHQRPLILITKYLSLSNSMNEAYHMQNAIPPLITMSSVHFFPCLIKFWFHFPFVRLLEKSDT